MIKPIWEHLFKDGSSVRLVMKAFKEAKRNVPFFQFSFRNNNKPMTLEVPMFDRNDEIDLLVTMADAIDKHLGRKIKKAKKEEDTVITLKEEDEKPFATQRFRERSCTDCRRDFIPESPAQKSCNFCRKPLGELENIQTKLEVAAENFHDKPVNEETDNG
jgi:hypothetical protein